MSNKPWYEEIKDRFYQLNQRFTTLDKRELLLQRQVAKLTEKVDWLIRLRRETQENKKERKIRDRFVAGLLVGLVISLIQIALELWRMSH